MELSYTYFALSGFLNALVSFVLGFLIFYRDKKNIINRRLAYFSFAVGLWSFFYMFWPLANSREGTLLAFRLLHIPACFVSIFYLHFVVHWLGIYKKNKYVILFGYIISIFFACSTFTKYFIADMVPKFSMHYWAEPGFLYTYYLIMFFGLFLYSSYLLIKRFFIEKGDKRRQIFLILLGIALSFFGGSTNYFLWYNINIPPYGNILASSFVVLTVYAIVRYRLFSAKIITTEIFLFLINLLLIIRFIFSSSNLYFILNGSILFVSIIISFILSRSVKEEVLKRENMTKLAHSIEKANLKLQELDRQKTDFLSIASHQLRTPLSITKGYIELIEDGAYGRITKSMKETFAKMGESNEGLIKLVDEFLDITRIEQGRTKFSFDYYDFNELIKTVVKDVSARAKSKKLKILFKENAQVKKVYCDEEKIRHVLFNYIDNAIKYSDKGKIEVILELEEEERVVVRVKDNGVGFTPEDDANFFQKFYRGKNVEGENVTGTGLGLYVCRKFIEKHDGEVWAKSPGLGEGSEFGFFIPKTNK